MSQADDLQVRTTAFAIETVKFCRSISPELETQRIKSQLISAATSVGANYRAARRARSHAEFTAKIGVVAEEADESEYWLSSSSPFRWDHPKRPKACTTNLLS